MSALTILRAASRDVANERYAEVMEAIDALAELVEVANDVRRFLLSDEWKYVSYMDGPDIHIDRETFAEALGYAIARFGEPA